MACDGTFGRVIVGKGYRNPGARVKAAACGQFLAPFPFAVGSDLAYNFGYSL